MPELPIEIWQKIIEFAYNPLRRGWHKDLCKIIALVSKMHCELVKYIFYNFVRKPRFPEQMPNILSETAVVHCLMQNLPEIMPGFLVEDSYIKKNPVRFTYTNCINNNDFFSSFTQQMNDNSIFEMYKSCRFLVAHSYTKIIKADYLHRKCNTYEQIKKPFIVLPFKKCVIIIGNDSIMKKIYCDDDHTYFYPKYMFSRHLSMLIFLRYIMNSNNELSDNVEEFILNVYSWVGVENS